MAALEEKMKKTMAELDGELVELLERVGHDQYREISFASQMGPEILAIKSPGDRVSMTVKYFFHRTGDGKNGISEEAGIIAPDFPESNPLRRDKFLTYEDFVKSKTYEQKLQVVVKLKEWGYS